MLDSFLFTATFTPTAFCPNKCFLQHILILLHSPSTCFLSLVSVFVSASPSLPLSRCILILFCVSRTHEGQSVVPLSICVPVLFERSSCSSRCSTLSLHINGRCFSENNSYLLGSVYAQTLRCDPPKESLSVSRSGACLRPGGEVMEDSL